MQATTWCFIVTYAVPGPYHVDFAIDGSDTQPGQQAVWHITNHGPAGSSTADRYLIMLPDTHACLSSLQPHDFYCKALHLLEALCGLRVGSCFVSNMGCV